MSRQTNEPIPGLPEPEEVHELNSDEVRRLLIDSFRFSQAVEPLQLLLFEYLHASNPEARLSTETYDSSFARAKLAIKAIVNDPRRHISTETDDKDLEQIIRQMSRMQWFLNGRERPSFESKAALLDTILVYMILADYLRLFSDHKFESKKALGRIRHKGPTFNPDSDPWLSQICHYVFHQGGVPYPHQVPITQAFQQLMGELKERLRVLMERPSQFLWPNTNLT